MAGDEQAWESLYRQANEAELPWFSETVDPDTEAALKRLAVGPQDGPVLDLGTGPGTFAIALAKRGFHVVASDISQSAIQMAFRRAGGYASKIEWVTADLFDCNWPQRFQLIHDRGVYHSLPQDSRSEYARLVPTWLRPGGHLLLKTFHEEEPGDWGPHRIQRKELEQNFGNPLETVEIGVSSFPGSMGITPKAWRAVFRAPAAP